MRVHLNNLPFPHYPCLTYQNTISHLQYDQNAGLFPHLNYLYICHHWTFLPPALLSLFCCVLSCSPLSFCPSDFLSIRPSFLLSLCPTVLLNLCTSFRSFCPSCLYSVFLSFCPFTLFYFCPTELMFFSQVLSFSVHQSSPLSLCSPLCSSVLSSKSALLYKLLSFSPNLLLSFCSPALLALPGYSYVFCS